MSDNAVLQGTDGAAPVDFGQKWFKYTSSEHGQLAKCSFCHSASAALQNESAKSSAAAIQTN